jgi:hypothetical protein
MTRVHNLLTNELLVRRDGPFWFQRKEGHTEAPVDGIYHYLIRPLTRWCLFNFRAGSTRRKHSAYAPPLAKERGTASNPVFRSTLI